MEWIGTEKLNLCSSETMLHRFFCVRLHAWWWACMGSSTIYMKTYNTELPTDDRRWNTKLRWINFIPSTSPEGAKLGCETRSGTHVAIDLSLENNNGSLPLANQQNLPAEIASQFKHREQSFTIVIVEQQFFVQKVLSTPALCVRCRRLNQSRALNKPGRDVPKGGSESRFWEALSSWATKSGWWTEAILEEASKKRNGRNHVRCNSSSWSDC